MNETLKLGLTLMIIGLLASVALAFTNEFTQEKIQAQIELQLQKSLNKVMPEADDFKEQGDYYMAYKDNNLLGRVLKVNSQGYSSVVQMVVGFDLKNKITGIDVLSQVETPGLGANVEKQEFLSQFTGKDPSEIKLKKDGGEIDAITGATITSRAVTDGLSSKYTDARTSATVSPKTDVDEEDSETETKT